MRPLLGTLISVHFEAAPELEIAVNQAYARAAELEQTFSKFREDSLLNQINNAPVGSAIPVSKDFAEIFNKALELRSASNAAFDPFGGAQHLSPPLFLDGDEILKFAACRLDLTGLAKGFVVDQMIDSLSNFHGVVNAGGDLRFVNTMERFADLRFEASVRRLEMNDNALASSQLNKSKLSSMSSTIYFLKPRAGLSDDASVSVVASHCLVADALCKVAWFAPHELTEKMARQLHAHIYFFSADGQLTDELA